LSSTTTEGRKRRDHRGRKAQLVRQLMRSRKQDGSVRLVDGSHEHEGRVEVFHDDRWGPICDDEWDERDAKVICAQLGYKDDKEDYKIEIRATQNGRFGQGKGRYWLDNVMCDGTESKLSECRHDGWGIHDCTDVETAGVICARVNPTSDENFLYTTKKPEIEKPRSQINDLDVRLAGGRVPHEGRVEIRLGNSQEWGLICGDGWSLLEAAVVCRQLDMNFAQDAPQTDYFGGSIEDVVTTGVKCDGTEEQMSECYHHDRNSNDTQVFCPGNGKNFASVVCTDRLPDLVPDAYEVQRSGYLEDKQLYFLQCSMEENCLASSAYKLQRENAYGWHLDTRRLLRFTAKIVNQGNADFRPAIPKHLWQFHACHQHYHSMEVFAVFDVLDREGRKIAEGHKASFCLEDNECTTTNENRYHCANYGDQGISVGCADIYRSNIDCQWVDVTDVIPGTYKFKVTINGEYKVPESDFSNNAVECRLDINQAGATITDCRVTRP
ncbi:unnamed protein product, partial [Allacma fusca]